MHGGHPCELILPPGALAKRGVAGGRWSSGGRQPVVRGLRLILLITTDCSCCYTTPRCQAFCFFLDTAREPDRCLCREFSRPHGPRD